MKVKNREEVRAEVMEVIANALGENVIGKSAGNTMVIPVKSKDGEEGYATITVTIPIGAKDGTPYNGFEEVDNFNAKQAQKAIDAENAAKAKAEKAAKREAAKAEKEKAKMVEA